MKKLVLVLLVGGFIASNLNAPQKDVSQKDHPPLVDEVNGTAIFEGIPVDNGEHHMLFVTLENEKVKKAVVSIMDSKAQTIEVASLTEENIAQCFDEKISGTNRLTKNDYLKNNLERCLGISINNIVAVEKQGFSVMYSKIFPKGMPLQLTANMKKDLHINDSSDMYFVDSDEFIKTMKILKQNPNYKDELHQIVIQAFYSQFTKPEIVMSIFTLISDSDKYLFTDLSFTDLITLGVKVMKNPIKDVQTLDIPNKGEQKVSDTLPSEWYSF
ncbi:hypothetical protein ACFSO7_17170 [Bacillus sp. CGMCC 1.16607]|uniref:hypothetical protein n=1 Tax=Bacillus sp. CGMCC 1.16607 TaxID=3351842 RepID=UPI00362A0AA4